MHDAHVRLYVRRHNLYVLLELFRLMAVAATAVVFLWFFAVGPFLGFA